MSAEVMEAPTRWHVVALGFFCGVVGMFQTAKVSIGFAAVAGDLGMSLFVASLAVTAVSVMGVLFGIQAGRATAEFGASRTLVFALLLTAAAGLITAFAGGPSTFLLGRIAEGVGYLLVCTAAPAMMAEAATSRDRGLALAIWGAFVPVAVAIMAVIGPLVVATSGWRPLFVGCALLALAMAGCVQVVWPPKAKGSGDIFAAIRRAPDDFANLYTYAPAMGLAVAFMAFAATQVGFIALQPIYLIREAGMDLARAGILVSVTTPFAIVGTIIAGILLRSGAPSGSTGVLAFAAMAAFGGATFLIGKGIAGTAYGPFAIFAVGAGMFTAGGVVASVVFASLPARATPKVDLPLLSGLIVQFGNIGAFVGAPLLAGVADAFSWTMAVAVLSGLAALGIAGLSLARA